MPDVISDTNGKLCVGSYHMWRLLSSPDNYSLWNSGNLVVVENSSLFGTKPHLFKDFS